MTPQQYLVQQAKAKGINPLDLATVMAHETGGKFNPDVWGGKGGRYYGLLQFGDNERKQFGVNSLNPSAENQIDAGLNFLAARGFKPGMSRMDMYSTVLAGSPGHNNRADQNGTVAQHIANMADNEQQARKWLGDALGEPSPGPVGNPTNLPGAASTATAEPNKKTDEIAEYLKKEKQPDYSALAQYGAGLLGGRQGKLLDPTPMMQPMQFQQGQSHIPNPQQFAGLLGR